MLDLSLLTVPGCPNGPVMLARLADVLADYPDARVARLVVHDEADALRLYLEGCSYEQMAVELGCDTKTIDNALQRVKRKVLSHQQSRQVLQ